MAKKRTTGRRVTTLVRNVIDALAFWVLIGGLAAAVIWPIDLRQQGTVTRSQAIWIGVGIGVEVIVVVAFIAAVSLALGFLREIADNTQAVRQAVQQQRVPPS